MMQKSLKIISIPYGRICVELDSPKAPNGKSTAIIYVTSVVNFTFQKREEVKPHESETRFPKLKRARSNTKTNMFGLLWVLCKTSANPQVRG